MRQLLAGGVPGLGVVVEGVIVVNKPSKTPEIYQNGKKMGGFVHVLAYKSPKMQFFAQKYLTRYTHETFFEEYMNFKTHYLSLCGVIPLQSFGSHICPQPHGLGLKGQSYQSGQSNMFEQSPMFFVVAKYIFVEQVNLCAKSMCL